MVHSSIFYSNKVKSVFPVYSEQQELTTNYQLAATHAAIAVNGNVINIKTMALVEKGKLRRLAVQALGWKFRETIAIASNLSHWAQTSCTYEYLYIYG